jgi:hypothetical protein
MNLASNAAYNFIASSSAAAQTTLQGVKVLDMDAYEGVCFICHVKSVTAGGVLQLQAMHGDAESTASMVNITATRVGSTSTTTDMEGQVVVCDVYKPLKRYVSASVRRDTQNSMVQVVAVRYGNRKGKVAQTTDAYGVIGSATFVSPTT